MSAQTTYGGSSRAERKFPPIEQISVAALLLVIIGGIYLASHLPRPVALGPSATLTVLAGVLVVINAALLSKIKNFDWRTFFLVAKWTLVAYCAIAGMLEFVFVFDDTRGSVLVLLTSNLVIFALNLPMLFGFSVARFSD